MLPPVNGQTQGYLHDLDRIQSVLSTLQRQVSSGIRVGVPSDDPAAVPVILKAQSEIAMNEQVQTNLNSVKLDLESGDSALQQAVKLMDQAISLATQAGTTTDGPQFAVFLQQAQSIQESLVGLTATAVNGRHIFSGDLDSQPPYALDATQANGVRLIAPANSTITIQDGAGNTVWRPRTATEIFDASDPALNVFGAVGQLISALRNQNSPAALDALGGLKSASEHLNQQLGLYGIGETRVTDALNASSASLVGEKQQLGLARDTDLAAAAVQLSQTTLQQQSALSVGARISQKSLFDFMA